MVAIDNVCFIGAGFVGGPSGAVLALKNPNVRVNVVDLNEKRISQWKSDNLPLYEPGLLEITKQCRDGLTRPQNLFFSTNIRHAIKTAQIIFVCVNTPTKTFGAGSGRASNLGYVESAIRMIAAEADSYKIIVEKSTVPCRTAGAIREILGQTCKKGLTFDILSNPEFLAEGTAVQDLLFPDRVLIGSLKDGEKATQALVDLYASWVSPDKILTINIWSSELAKLAANALLAQRISSINALSAVCEATGADIGEISYAVGVDNRLGPKMLQASVGFGGSCFRKDVLNLAYMAESLNLPEVAAYWQSVVAINEWQKDRFTNRIIRCLYNSITHKKIAVFGFAYKKNTSDCRESAAISVVRNLLTEGAQVCIFDPQVSEQDIMAEMNNCSSQDMLENLSVAGNAYEAAKDSHAVVIMTEWDMFKKKRPSGQKHDSAQFSYDLSTGNGLELLKHAEARSDSKNDDCLDWSLIYRDMQRPAFVFDGRRIVDRKELEQLGFFVETVGAAGRGSTWKAI